MSNQSLARLALAEKRAAAAKGRLGQTLGEIQHKLSPANILGEATRNLKEKGLQMTDQAFVSIKSRPLLATAVGSALALLAGKRPWLVLLLKLFLRGSATVASREHSIGSTPQRPRRRSARAVKRSEENA